MHIQLKVNCKKMFIYIKVPFYPQRAAIKSIEEKKQSLLNNTNNERALLGRLSSPTVTLPVVLTFTRSPLNIQLKIPSLLLQALVTARAHTHTQLM